MKVIYTHEKSRIHTGNIKWDGRWPMRSGKFPKSHPVGGGLKPGTDQFGTGANIESFRARGYWASCYPEGDGITLNCLNGQMAEQIERDIRDCFGWEVRSGKK